MTTVFIVVAVALTIGLAVVLLRQPHPEDTATSGEEPGGDTQAARFANDRPAGPDAEATGVASDGNPAPDPDIADEQRPSGT